MKKILCTALALSMATSGVAAFAANSGEVEIRPISAEIQPISADLNEDGMMHTMFTNNRIAIGDQAITIDSMNATTLPSDSGTVSLLEDGRLLLRGTDEEGASYDKLVLSVSEHTRIIDAATGLTAKLEDIKDGDKIYVYTSPVMALSMPAQTSAELIIVGVEEGGIVPVYAEINSIVRNEEKGTVTLITDQAVNITLTEETVVTPYLTRQFITKDSLIPGQKILAWYPFVLESYPAQATAQKVVAFNFDYSGSLSLDADGNVTLNQEPMKFDRLAMPRLTEDGYALPLRKVAEALGCEVTWIAESGEVSVSKNGEELYRLTFGSDVVTLGERSTYLKQPVETFMNVTYLDVNDIIALHNLKFSAN